MAQDLDYLEGRRLCVVFVKVVDGDKGKVKCQPVHGRANVEGSKLSVVTPEGASVAVPRTAHSTIMPNDGTEMLKEAEYFVLVKMDPGIGFFDSGE